MCVEYPGVVRNVDAMLQTLGGIDNVSRVMQEPNRRLELRFRPDDVFCKPTCGERSTDTTSFVVRAKRMRNKRTGETKLVSEVVGTVHTTFKFQSLCDFQYLPVVKEDKATGTSKSGPGYRPIYDEIYFDRLVELPWLQQGGKSAPLFLPPAAFSRMDIPQDYQFRREAASEKTAAGAGDKDATPYNIIGRTRTRRSHHAIFVAYDVDQVPEQPRDVAFNQLKVKFISESDQKCVRDLFAAHPVWPKNKLVAVTGISPERIKFLLPAMAYYFTTGPWRNQWVRFGFDPRREPEAAKYQTLDYRVRLQGGARHMVKAKRNYANYLLPYKATNFSKPKTSVIDRGSFSALAKGDASAAAKGAAAPAERDTSNKDAYIFRKDSVPPYRQMFYQFQDLAVEEAEQVIRENLRATGRTVCDEKNGWFAAGTDSKLREIMSECVSRHLANERGKEAGAGESKNDKDSPGVRIDEGTEDRGDEEEEDERDFSSSDSESEVDQVAANVESQVLQTIAGDDSL